MRFVSSRLARFCASVAAACWIGGELAAAPMSAQPLRLDDLLALEGYDGAPGPANVALAPDGAAVAFIRRRADATLTRFPTGPDLPFVRGNTDVWVQLTSGEAPVNITRGQEDQSGWMTPAWSPDGRHLAMLSTRGGGLRLWVWTRGDGALRPLTARSVDLEAAPRLPFDWVDARHVVLPLLPAGELPLAMSYPAAVSRLAPAAWARKVKGESTASVLESGVPAAGPTRSASQLALVDVESGESRVLADGAALDFVVSPRGDRVAFFRPTTAFEPGDAEILSTNKADDNSTLEVVDLEGRVRFSGVRSAIDAMPASARWSPDGSELVFLAYDGDRAAPPRLARIDSATGRLRWIDLGTLDAAPLRRDAVLARPQMEWTALGDLILWAAERTERNKPESTTRRDWWLIRRNGTRRSLTAELKQETRSIGIDPGRPDAVLVIADGELWRLPTRGGKGENLTASIAAPVTRAIWAPWPERPGVPKSTGTRSVVLETHGPDARAADYVRLELSSGATTPLAKPRPQALLSAWSPITGSAIFSVTGAEGAFVWRTTPEAVQPETLLAANTFLAERGIGELKQIDYVALDGRPLRAWLILPLGYRAGRRYPLLTWVYAGRVNGSQPPQEAGLALMPGALNMQLAAAQGYGVLFPSMPLAPYGAVEDTLAALPNGVLPAVDKAIEMGIADGERLFVAGMSYGGYSTCGLITQTHRFKAAVAIAGLTDLIATYGVFDINRRYTDDAVTSGRLGLYSPSFFESGQGRMGVPPWQDPQRYVRNSPALHVDRIETPLLIAHGDLDIVPIDNAEELFVGLRRQGKRAQFVRYWGESHWINSPGNVRDLWARMFAWLDEFGDIARDADGALLWNGSSVQSRNGVPALTAEQYRQRPRFFAPVAP